MGQRDMTKGAMPLVMTEFADFKHRCLTSVFPRNTGYMWPEVTFRDLPQTNAILWGTAYDANGDIFSFVREMPPRGAFALSLSSNRGGDSIRPLAEGAAAYRGNVEVATTPDGLRWRSLDYLALSKPSLSVEIAGDKLRWSEDGILDFEATLTPHAIQWFDPMPKPQQGMAYVFQFARFHGTLLGQQVDGWMGYDFQYGSPGMTMLESPLWRRGEAPGVNVSYPAFCNEYEDGSYECGTIGVGLEDWGFAAIFDGKGEVLRGRCLDFEVELPPNRMPTRMVYKLWDDVSGKVEDWIWTLHPRGEMRSDHKPAHMHDFYFAEGVFMRAGETRKLKRVLGWPDFHADGRYDLYKAGSRG